jgi:hypothetical protein
MTGFFIKWNYYKKKILYNKYTKNLRQAVKEV